MTPITPAVIREYVEPEFVIDYEVIGRIQKEGVIPRWYLLQDLQALTNEQDHLNAGAGTQGNSRGARETKSSQRINYITATYFLLCKRKELEDLQKRQQEGARASSTSID